MPERISPIRTDWLSLSVAQASSISRTCILSICEHVCVWMSVCVCALLLFEWSFVCFTVCDWQKEGRRFWLCVCISITKDRIRANILGMSLSLCMYSGCRRMRAIFQWVRATENGRIEEMTESEPGRDKISSLIWQTLYRMSFRVCVCLSSFPANKTYIDVLHVYTFCFGTDDLYVGRWLQCCVTNINVCRCLPTVNDATSWRI